MPSQGAYLDARNDYEALGFDELENTSEGVMIGDSDSI